MASEDEHDEEVEDEYDLETSGTIGHGVELDIEDEYQDVPPHMKHTGGEALDEDPPIDDLEDVVGIEDDKEPGDIEDDIEPGEIEDDKEPGEIEDDKEPGEIEEDKEPGEIEEEEETGEEAEETGEEAEETGEEAGETGEVEDETPAEAEECAEAEESAEAEEPAEGGEPAEGEEVEDVEDVVEEVQEEKPDDQPKEGTFMATCGTGGMLLVDASHDTWPRELSLFVLRSMYDVPLPEHADCLAVDVVLRICGVDFEVDDPLNVDYMSPSGRAPMIKCGRQLVSELDPILRHLSRKGASLSGELPDESLQKQQELWSLVQTSLVEAEQRVCWLHQKTRSRLTLPSVAGLYPWPLSFFIGRRKRREALAHLASTENPSDLELSLDNVYKQVDDVCNRLSTELDPGPYFFGATPTELDALVYGHLFLLLSVPVPVDESTTFTQLVQEYPNLVSMVAKIDEEVYGRDLELMMSA